jgi:signal transduction histidine kinase
MVSGDPISVIILGAGTGGTSLLELFARSPGVQVVGIADKDHDAPGLKRARELNIPASQDVADLISRSRDGTSLIIDVTGDPAMAGFIARQNPRGIQVLGGTAARLLWNLVQHEARIQAQLFQAEKLATIGTFTSGIAHDINNPLYLVMSLAEDMLDEPGPAVIQDHARDIVQAVRRIAAIVKGLTLYARFSWADDLVEVDLSSALDEALKLARYATVVDEIDVARDYDSRPVVRGRPEEILQVCVNIVTNAVQAMNGRGALRLSTRREDGMVTATIADTGPGIPRDVLDKIFDPFFTTKEPGKGTGLGLHIAQTIVKKYGGLIAVSSQENRGTTFRLQFPSAG